MSGVPYFNAPWFDETEILLRALPGIDAVFNPAERDRVRGFEPLNCPLGTFEEAREAGFDAGDALAEDWDWIARYADCVVVGELWKDSPGAVSEVACIQARRKPAYNLAVFQRYYPHDQEMLRRMAIRPILEIRHPAGYFDDWIFNGV